MPGVLEAIESSDVTVMASPVYYFALSAQTKAMIDRFYCKGKPAIKRMLLMLSSHSPNAFSACISQYKAMHEYIGFEDMGMFTAAVADFSPRPFGAAKFKKADAPQGFSVEFAPNPDILRTLAAERTPEQKVLGFAAETPDNMDALLELARVKLATKQADVLAANDVNAPGSGFGAATNAVAVADAEGRGEIWPTRSKADVAWDLCTWLLRS